MSHILKSIYDKANKNRTPRKEPPLTSYHIDPTEIERLYPTNPTKRKR